MDDKPVFICLTPVRDEAWILEEFIEMAATWADYIIILDQCSTDCSREIAKRHAKVILVENDNPEFDEKFRQNTLLEKAREITGKRILIALDADEALTANFISSGDKQRIGEAAPGTIIKFRWPQILKNYTECSMLKHTVFGYVDDGAQHYPETIHSLRLPTPEKSPELCIDKTCNMHLVYLGWKRQKRKQKWYQCWETLHSEDKSAVRIFRLYNRHILYNSSNIVSVPEEWVNDYKQIGVSFESITAKQDQNTWWDKQIVEWINLYSSKCFEKVDIWDTDWVELANKEKIRINEENFYDPRGRGTKLAFFWLKNTTNYSRTIPVRIIDRILKKIGF